MPTLALHSQYWQTTAGEPEPPIGGSAPGGYIPWKTTITVNGGFGVGVVLWLMVLPLAK